VVKCFQADAYLLLSHDNVFSNKNQASSPGSW
jgi:hypothetical protein